IRDGTLVGVVKDMGFDAFTYEIHSIFVHPACSFVKRILPWFFPCEEIEIAINEIESITGDVILVKFH
ncbi:MAG: sporulation protein, partial [Longicatena sp.]